LSNIDVGDKMFMQSELNLRQEHANLLWCTQSKATTFLFCGQISDLIIQSRETIKNF